jgi:hypothetical protein
MLARSLLWGCLSRGEADPLCNNGQIKFLKSRLPGARPNNGG